MTLEIKTAAELIALDIEGRQAARRAARETELMRHVLRTFVDRTDPVQLEEIVAAFPGQPPEKVFAALVALDEDDMVRISAGRVDLAYPFSVSPTPFMVWVGKRAEDERRACDSH